MTDSAVSGSIISRLIVISGPSGAGKGTIIKALMSQVPRLRLSVSATTRPMRPGELEARDYYFVSRTEFEAQVRDGMFLEWAEYAGNLYGTPSRAVDEGLSRGADVILEIELQGADQVLQLRDDAVMVYIMPPSYDELERRLRGRKTEGERAICSRLARAKEEIALVEKKEREGLPTNHYVIVNDDIERASGELAGIIERIREDDEQTHC